MIPENELARQIWLARRDMREGLTMIARAIIMVGHKDLKTYKDPGVEGVSGTVEYFRMLLDDYARGNFWDGEGNEHGLYGKDAPWRKDKETGQS